MRGTVYEWLSCRPLILAFVCHGLLTKIVGDDASRGIGCYTTSNPIGWIVSQARNPAQSGFDPCDAFLQKAAP